MKFLHTADLHIGKTVNEFSMLEEQRHILNRIHRIALEEKVDAVLIAGDVYDRPIPSTEAVELLDDFLTGLLAVKIPVILISGNHDSGERVAFADRILEKQGLYIAGGYEGECKRVVLEDEWGYVDFVCMPFVKPSVASVEEMLAATPMTLDLSTRHVLLTHYFVTGESGELPELSDSETTVNVGGLDSVSAALFASFDYVALGHIHKRQKVGKGNVWYAGAPLKYSFSEVNQVKSVNLVTLGKKGEVLVESRELIPLHEMRIIKGRLHNLIDAGVVDEADKEDYIKAVLTDTEELIDPLTTLRNVYPNLMQMELEIRTAAQEGAYQLTGQVTAKSLEELFGDFYQLLCGEKMDEKRTAIVREAEEAVREEIQRDYETGKISD